MQIAIILLEHARIYIFRETSCGVKKYTVERSEQAEVVHARNAAYPSMIGSPQSEGSHVYYVFTPNR